MYICSHLQKTVMGFCTFQGMFYKFLLITCDKFDSVLNFGVNISADYEILNTQDGYTHTVRVSSMQQLSRLADIRDCPNYVICVESVEIHIHVERAALRS